MSEVLIQPELVRATWGHSRSLDVASLPNGLQLFVIGLGFKQSLENMSLPSGLQQHAFGNTSTRVWTT